jgi:hypothetical protein
MVIRMLKASPSHLQALKLPSSFDVDKLPVQLRLLPDFVKGEKILVRCAHDLATALGDKDDTTRLLFREVERFIQLILSLPCSVASAERSFSHLRRLKTWLRSSMSQSRLTHLALMAVHRHRLQAIDINKLMSTFIRKTPERISVFGKL